MWKKNLMGEIDSTVAIATEQRLIVGCDNKIVFFLKEPDYEFKN